jgi:hypothetical protein
MASSESEEERMLAALGDGKKPVGRYSRSSIRSRQATRLR